MISNKIKFRTKLRFQFAQTTGKFARNCIQSDVFFFTQTMLVKAYKKGLIATIDNNKQ